MPQIYISYRQSDSKNVAERLYQQLLKSFDATDIMIDSTLIKPGDDWRQALQGGLDRCDTMLVIIGPDWLTVTNSEGQPRLWVDDDWVRYEVEFALRNQRHIRLIPVLVRNARMPAEGELPESIRDVAYLFASPVSDGPNFFADTANLVEAIRRNSETPDVPVAQSSGNQQTGGQDNVQQNVDSVSGGALFGSVRGEHITINTGGTGGSEASSTPPDLPKKQPWYQNSTIIAAMITVIGTVVVALIGIVPPLIEQSANQSATAAAIATAQVINQTETALANALTETQAAMPTNSPEPPTDTLAPSTATSLPPTMTDSLVPPSETPSPPNTSTSLPPTFTSVPQVVNVTPTTTSVAPAADTVALTLYRDEDSLTLFVPQTDETLSLVGFEYHVTLPDRRIIARRLDVDFIGFLSMPFANIGSLRRGSCFRLVRSGATRPTPQACQGNVLLLTQEVALADGFWRDGSAGVDRTVLVYRDDQLVAACGPEPQCDINWPTTAEVAAVPSSAVSSGYPCEGTIINPDSSANIISILYEEASETSQRGPAIRVGTAITVQREITDNEGRDWFLLYDGTQRLGWSLTRYVSPLTGCTSG